MSTTMESAAARTQKLEGLGTKRKRVEDARFTQGKGNYVDDMKLPGMLFGDFVRSPYGHARIKSIKKDKALALPGVKAVLTAEELKPLKLHYMPTLAGDVQAVLADGKVLFQGQEIAFVIAEDRYIAADAVETHRGRIRGIAPHSSIRTLAMAPNAPVLRDDLQGKTSGAHGPRKHHNHVFSWEVGDAAATTKALKDAPVVAKETIIYQRVHPCPIETCGCVASMDKINGHLTVWGTFQAAHAVRTVASLISGIPEHKIRIVSPDIGGGFGNKVGVYPGYICAIVASIVLGVPVKWIEDRTENLASTAFARDYHMTGEIAATKDGRITGLRCHVLADHGAFDACADPTKYPAGFFSICTGSYDIPVAHLTVDGVYTNKAPGGVAYRCSFRVTEASYFIERMIDVLARKLNMDPAELRRRNFIKKEQFPYHSALGWGIRQRRLSPPPSTRRLRRSTTRVFEKSSARTAKLSRAGRPASCSASASPSSPRSSVPVRSRTATSSASACSIPARFACIRPAAPSRGSARSARVRGTPRPLPRSWRPKSAFPPRNITIEEGDTDTAPYGLGNLWFPLHARRRALRTAMAGRKIRAKAQNDRRLSARGARRRPRMGHRFASASKARPSASRPWPSWPFRPTTKCRRVWNRASKRSATTIRPT